MENKILGKIVPPTHKWGGGISFYPYICGMETKDMIYGESHIQNGGYIKYYSYYDYDQNWLVVTENFYEHITQSERYKMGGNMGIHSIVKNT